MLFTNIINAKLKESIHFQKKKKKEVISVLFDDERKKVWCQRVGYMWLVLFRQEKGLLIRMLQINEELTNHGDVSQNKQ